MITKWNQCRIGVDVLPPAVGGGRCYHCALLAPPFPEPGSFSAVNEDLNNEC